MFIFYCLTLLILSVYSYALVDLNLTLINNPLWVAFREYLIQLGYFQRTLSWYLYILVIIILFVFHYYFLKKYQNYPAVKIALFTGILLSVSYPFLSHDLFNYIFDAKIFTFYGKNPYISKPADFAGDEWLRFMHWIHRTYPYGPVYLVLSFIPSFLGAGKFLFHFFFFKLFNVIFYVTGVYFLNKINKKSAIVFATHPLVLIEGLVNTHNDLIGVAIACIGLYYIESKRNIIGRLYLLFSSGIKYITFPVLLISKNNKVFITAAFILQLALLFYLSVFNEIQPWYYLSLFVYLPYFYDVILSWNIFLSGLLISYYPYIVLGGWDSKEKVDLKHYIIFSSVLINLLYILMQNRKHYLSYPEIRNIFKK